MRTFLGGFIFWGVGLSLSLFGGWSVDAPTELLTQLRLPRAIQGSAVGAGLSVAGALLQALFSNPLCEPYTLGISSGAALGAVLGAALGWGLSWGGLAGGALLGALGFSAILYALSFRFRNQTQGLLLSGVMLGFLGSSLVALLMAISDTRGVQGALYWLLGDLSRSRLSGSVFSLGWVVVLTLGVWGKRAVLDAFLLGEEGARSVGVDSGQERKKLLALSCLMVAVSVSGAGMVGFVGLMVPHAVRRRVGALHGRLLPGVFVWGAGALVWADWLARWVADPYELPVGVVTALVGAPFFIAIVARRGAAEL